MAFLTVNNVSIKGISACTSCRIEENLTLNSFLNQEEATKFIASTGIERRRISDESTTTSDLCFYAAEKLISDLDWNKGDIDCLVFVTQTPDYILPATSCILQNRLGLSEDCYTLDVSLGCSGWVYGMSVIANLMSTGSFKRGLLLAGDVLSKICSKSDKSTYPLFGDAGTVTALEYMNSDNTQYLNFQFGSDGSGYDAIIIPDGGYRNISSKKSYDYVKVEDEISRNSIQLILNGMDVFSFGISKAPESVNKLLNQKNIIKDEIDYFLFHQANMFMNEKIRKKLKLSEDKVPYSLKDFGNTSSASIPLTMVTELKEELKNRKLNLIACGFGVGLSWGSVSFSTDNICVPDLIEI